MSCINAAHYANLAAASAGGQERLTSQDELAIAMRESLQLQEQEEQPGLPLLQPDIQEGHLYFEQQAPGSDTCGMNALNNLCQRPIFKLEDLQNAEAEHARVQQGGGVFAQVDALPEIPTGFFEVEALKIAASTVDLEIVDVEPVISFCESRCAAFCDSARSSGGDGSWFLGFLVYDRRPGQMHYYVLRRDERYEGIWLKLDSWTVDSGKEPRNRRLKEADLWALYDSNAQHFQAWLLRWYPVVYRAGAARAVCAAVGEGPQRYDIGEVQALEALRHCDWFVPRAIEHLIRELPQTVLQELLVTFARPTEAEMRQALELVGWDLSKAQPAVSELLSKRLKTVTASVEASGTRLRALSMCDWQPEKAAKLLALQLQLESDTSVVAFRELREALKLAGDDVDRAESVVRLAEVVGNMAHSASLLEQTRTWSIVQAQRIVQVRKRFPQVPAVAAMEVLQKTDDDPRAACEALKDVVKRVQEHVMAAAGQGLFQGEEVLVAEAALNSADWDPERTRATAKNLALAVQQTRRLMSSRGISKFFSAEAVLPALTAGDLKPQAAVAILLGEPVPKEAAPVPAPPRKAGAPPTQPVASAAAAAPPPRSQPGMEKPQPAARRPQQQEDDDGCSVM
eukprot:gnl/TRDRNA2_/TRDRNA2_92313_c0_seq1.p1 gnl/TRDRNA2_/TRDRNA2_92313_c0~~gnl/TRDRNA2_/TRDRNA2_92313_c0_seq1.p1  ORF type:complete len:626 (+),score=166.36 gnl/TRDRNA2_/TRDRNA2_92313_c0_seq1:87-1964(+)